MEQITNLFQLEQAAEDKRAIVVPKHDAWKKPNPAAWIINLSGIALLGLFKLGMFVYKPGEKKNE